MLERAENDPEFETLVGARSRLAWILTTIMMIIYFGFILTIAFAPAHLGAPIGSGVTTVGIPIGVFIIPLSLCPDRLLCLASQFYF